MKSQVTILLLLIVTSCSLEAARQRRINSATTEARSAVTRQVTQCEAWDTIHVWGDWTAGVSAGVGATAAGLASQVEGKTADVATGVAIGAGVVSAGALVLATQSASAWAERCGQ
jgi:hypothetical protein